LFPGFSNQPSKRGIVRPFLAAKRDVDVGGAVAVLQVNVAGGVLALVLL
jgi:hypothetical protein